MGSKLNEYDFGMGPRAHRSGCAWTVLTWEALPTFIFAEQREGAELWAGGDFRRCHLLQTQRQGVSNHLWGCTSWGILETPPWSTLGAQFLRGSQGQMGENPARLFLGRVRAALTSLGMGSPAKVRCRDFPQGPQPIPSGGSCCEKLSRQL